MPTKEEVVLQRIGEEVGGLVVRLGRSDSQISFDGMFLVVSEHNVNKPQVWYKGRMNIIRERRTEGKDQLMLYFVRGENESFGYGFYTVRDPKWEIKNSSEAALAHLGEICASAPILIESPGGFIHGSQARFYPKLN